MVEEQFNMQIDAIAQKCTLFYIKLYDETNDHVNFVNLLMFTFNSC